ncbi:reverse transcriptase domain-containing protein [Desulfobacterales bacterium HSG16]|nr:reverse transcriptase domain-containing protein [Desulfobacterales bacterium HSG16]
MMDNYLHLIFRTASDSVLDDAFDWLCERRKNYPHNSDIWHFRMNWQYIKPELKMRLVTGEYSFEPLSEIRRVDDIINLWSSQDALVLKALSIVLYDHLNPVLSDRCFHLKDRGGVKAALRETCKNIENGVHVMKSDIKSYYASMDHQILYDLAYEYIPDPYVMRLLWQYMNRNICFGGQYKEVKRGISLGCPLSPLMGALYLKPLDDLMEKTGLFYARFMDDWIVIAPTRWKLRKAVRTVNGVLNQLKVEQHPDKTFIGRSEHGVNFLGYFIKPEHLTVSQGTLANAAKRIARLYEQGADENRIGQYISRFADWLFGSLDDGCLSILFFFCVPTPSSPDDWYRYQPGNYCHCVC